ncbi:MAG TPA: MFS transporter, partial [Candidatus Limnocylindrales bacterium]|nr:MFS transporter [Candidatus Limnocylindrales bacterium]
NEVGPFLAVEQAGLAQIVPDRRRTSTFAWYNLAGYVATAVGALTAGLLTAALLGAGWSDVEAYRAVVLGYAALGLAMAGGFALVGPATEPAPSVVVRDAEDRRRLGLGRRSRGIIARLSALFALDAFAGGFVPQALMAYWFHLRFGVEPAALGALFFAANLLAAVSSLSAARIAARIGLVNTMVFTHLPSNVLLILVPFMPTLPLAVICLLARYALSQMDVPTRQSYVMAVVDPDERSAAAGVTGIARTTGAAVSPAISAPLIASASFAGLPFVIAGGLKIVYDLSLWVAFRAHPAPSERLAPET